ncbi:serine O-acetyltransferase [Butyrivibrio sp. VCB2006]|uniref:serine O-acetyltransferase n=1 Tax=Butyrivibrio sp. VCB2006 TaxID=1280679 RepID=UPI0004103675|nr:hypothetical protein [Butyrivibrio sp. VCB2006]
MGNEKQGNSFISIIAADLSRIIEKDASFGDFLKTYFFPKGTTFPYIFWLRAVSCLKQKKLRILAVLPYAIMRHYEYKYDIHVNSNIHIGKGLHIVHGGAVYLNCSSIGENFTVYQCVTLGSKKYGKEWKDEIPSVGDNVSIYKGATVCGKIHIGNETIIGANAYVDSDTEEKSVIIGPAGRKR